MLNVDRYNTATVKASACGGDSNACLNAGGHDTCPDPAPCRHDKHLLPCPTYHITQEKTFIPNWSSLRKRYSKFPSGGDLGKFILAPNLAFRLDFRQDEYSSTKRTWWHSIRHFRVTREKPKEWHLQVYGGQVVPGVAILRLLLRGSAERLQRAAKVAGFKRTVAERKPALRVQRIHSQRQLPMRRRLRPSRLQVRFWLMSKEGGSWSLQCGSLGAWFPWEPAFLGRMIS